MFRTMSPYIQNSKCIRSTSSHSKDTPLIALYLADAVFAILRCSSIPDASTANTRREQPWGSLHITHVIKHLEEKLFCMPFKTKLKTLSNTIFNLSLNNIGLYLFFNFLDSCWPRLGRNYSYGGAVWTAHTLEFSWDISWWVSWAGLHGACLGGHLLPPGGNHGQSCTMLWGT